MEERGPPSTGAGNFDGDSASASAETQLVPYGQNSEPNNTYIIHFPKDQIYRVPPPENATHRPVIKKKSRKCWCWGSILIFIVLFLIAGVTVLVWYLLLDPKDPEFSITEVYVKQEKASKSSKNSDIRYHITLKTVNPNVKMSMKLKDGGGTSLLHGQKGFAKGKFPSDQLDDDESNIVKLVLKGTSASLPSEVEDSLGETSSKKKKKPVSLDLQISDLPVHIKYGSFKSWDKKLKVDCKFKVDTLGSGTKVLEQECEEILK